jgi:acyl-CoA hydrolase
MCAVWSIHRYFRAQGAKQADRRVRRDAFFCFVLFVAEHKRRRKREGRKKEPPEKEKKKRKRKEKKKTRENRKVKKKNEINWQKGSKTSEQPTRIAL